MKVEAARLEKSKGVISEAWLWRHIVQPFDMLNDLWSSFCFLIERCLNPLKPVAFFKPRWHFCDPLILHELFESVDTSLLKFGNIVPSIVYFAVIAACMVPCHLIFVIRDNEVAFEGRHIHGILPVVALIFGVLWVRVVYRLPQFLHVLFVCYFLVEIAIVGASAIIRSYHWPIKQQLVLSVRSAHHMNLI